MIKTGFVQTAFGPGAVREWQTDRRGHRSFRVEGDNFSTWVDEGELRGQNPQIQLAGRESWDPDILRGLGGRDLPGVDNSYEEEPGPGLDHRPRKWPGLTDRMNEEYPDNDPYSPGGGTNLGTKPYGNFASVYEADAGPGGNVWDNSTTLPYNPSPQYPAIDNNQGEGTIQPIHEIDPEDRLESADSQDFSVQPERQWPGPDPDLFARPASKQYDFIEAVPIDQRFVNHILASDDRDDPVVQFRLDPVEFTNRMGHIYSDVPMDANFIEYGYLVESDPQVREAAWGDVRTKALRLRREGKVHVKDIDVDRIYAMVEGDHGDYNVLVVKGHAFSPSYGPTGTQSISNWHCACEWGNWAFKRQYKYIGRLCSHGYAAYLEMQSQHQQDKPQPRGEGGRFIRRHRPVFSSSRYAMPAPRGTDPNFAPHSEGGEHGDIYYGDGDWFSDYGLEPDATDRARWQDLTRQRDESIKQYIENTGLDPYVPEWQAREERDERERRNKQADTLYTQPRQLIPDFIFHEDEDEDDDEGMVDLEEDERKTTAPENIMHWSAKQGAGRWVTPVDPDCPEVAEFTQNLWDDPMTGYSGVGDEVQEDFERRHLNKCKRCQEFGAANIDADYTARRRHAEDQKPQDWEVDNWNGVEPKLDKLRSEYNDPEQNLQHMDERNDRVTDLIEELRDSGLDVGGFVAAKDENFPNPQLNFLDEPFDGLGAASRDEMGSSADYVDDNERDRFQDVTDLGDDPIIKYEQGRNTVANVLDDNWWRTGAGNSGNKPDGKPATSTMNDYVAWCEQNDYAPSNPLARYEWQEKNGPIEASNKQGGGYSGPAGTNSPTTDTSGLNMGIDTMQAPAAGTSGSPLSDITAPTPAPTPAPATLPGMGGGDIWSPGDFNDNMPTVQPGGSGIQTASHDPLAWLMESDASPNTGGPFNEDAIAANAQAALKQSMQRFAGRNYNEMEQLALILETHPLGARNLPTEDELEGTHYV